MRPSPVPSRRLAALPLLLCAGLAGCDDLDAFEGAHEVGESARSGGPPAGELLADPHQGGSAPAPRVAEVVWGRLVDVHGLDPASGERILLHAGLLVGPAAGLEGGGAVLERDPLTAVERLVIPHAAGSAAYQVELAAALASVVPLRARSEQAWLLSPEDPVPSDAALGVRVDDLLDPTSLGAVALEVESGGVWTQVPARVLPDPNHGGHGADGAPAHTRLVVDPAISALEALRADQVLQPAPRGLPLGDGATAGARLRLAGLRTLSGTDVGVAQRAFTVGGAALAAGAPFAVVGVQPIALLRADPVGGGLYQLGWSFATPSCLMRVEPGDLVQVGNAVFEVVQSALPKVYRPDLGAVGRVIAALIAGTPQDVMTGPGSYTSTFDPELGDKPPCFVQVSPAPTQPPSQGLSPQSTFTLRFSAPVDPASVQPLGTLELSTLQPVPDALHETVVAEAQLSADLRAVTLSPLVPLDHQQGTAERYVLQVGGVRSASGAALEDPLPAVVFALDPNAATQRSGNLSLTFEEVDEDGDGAPEVRGQVLYDLAAGLLRPRPPTRFSVVIDPQQLMVGSMTEFMVPVQTPLVPFGSRAMSVWRYHDMGMSLLDSADHDLDVEGLAWAPFGGSVLADDFAEFRMALAHAGRLPDEHINHLTLFPTYPMSGLVTTFDQNAAEPLDVVHPRPAGYLINPLDAFVAPTGTLLMPWPLNRNVPPSQYEHFTWRDTAKTFVGAPFGAGADTARWLQVTGVGDVGFYPPGQVPTIGLPLLTEFRTHPDMSALGLNGLRVALAINSSAQPAFRAYSSGGLTPSGPVFVDPDNEPVAMGGFSPQTGAPTPPIDNVFHYGQADFVVRVSRMHTRWLDTAVPSPTFAPALLESQLPPGTQVVAAFRGASAIFATSGEPYKNAQNLDPYGDSFTPAQLAALGLPFSNGFQVTFASGDPSWKSDLATLVGARHVQARVTLISNHVTSESPHLTGLGIAFQH